MHRASYYNVYINQRDAQILVDSLYFFVKCSTCFGLSLVHHQEQNLISCTEQLVHTSTSGCSKTYWCVPIALYSLLNFVPDDGLIIVRNM